MDQASLEGIASDSLRVTESITIAQSLEKDSIKTRANPSTVSAILENGESPSPENMGSAEIEAQFSNDLNTCFQCHQMFQLVVFVDGTPQRDAADRCLSCYFDVEIKSLIQQRKANQGEPLSVDDQAEILDSLSDTCQTFTNVLSSSAHVTLPSDLECIYRVIKEQQGKLARQTLPQNDSVNVRLGPFINTETFEKRLKKSLRRTKTKDSESSEHDRGLPMTPEEPSRDSSACFVDQCYLDPPAAECSQISLRSDQQNQDQAISQPQYTTEYCKGCEIPVPSYRYKFRTKGEDPGHCIGCRAVKRFYMNHPLEEALGISEIEEELKSCIKTWAARLKDELEIKVDRDEITDILNHARSNVRKKYPRPCQRRGPITSTVSQSCSVDQNDSASTPTGKADSPDEGRSAIRTRDTKDPNDKATTSAKRKHGLDTPTKSPEHKRARSVTNKSSQGNSLNDRLYGDVVASNDTTASFPDRTPTDLTSPSDICSVDTYLIPAIERTQQTSVVNAQPLYNQRSNDHDSPSADAENPLHGPDGGQSTHEDAIPDSDEEADGEEDNNNNNGSGSQYSSDSEDEYDDGEESDSDESSWSITVIGEKFGEVRCNIGALEKIFQDAEITSDMQIAVCAFLDDLNMRLEESRYKFEEPIRECKEAYEQYSKSRAQFEAAETTYKTACGKYRLQLRQMQRASDFWKRDVEASEKSCDIS